MCISLRLFSGSSLFGGVVLGRSEDPLSGRESHFKSVGSTWYRIRDIRRSSNLVRVRFLTTQKIFRLDKRPLPRVLPCITGICQMGNLWDTDHFTSPGPKRSNPQLARHLCVTSVEHLFWAPGTFTGATNLPVHRMTESGFSRLTY